MVVTGLASAKNGYEVGVGLDNRLFVGPAEYSEAFNGTLGTDDAVVNIVPAVADCLFVITDIVLKGNKSIDPNTDAVVDVYEANSETNSAALKTIMSVPLERSGRLVLNGVFLGTAVASYVNAKTSDDDVFVTIFGYYVKIQETL
jgi:hypothetical protein